MCVCLRARMHMCMVCACASFTHIFNLQITAAFCAYKSSYVAHMTSACIIIYVCVHLYIIFRVRILTSNYMH